MKKTRKAKIDGFTDTLIEKTNANTRAVFGDYISIYDIQRAVADQATEWKMSKDEFEMPN